MVATTIIILEQSFLYFPLVLGAYVSISLMKVPDLSIETAYVFGAILVSKCLGLVEECHGGIYLFVVVLASLLGGMLVGLISGVLTKIARLPHLLSSILTIGVFHGINQLVLGSSNVSVSHYKNPLAFFTDYLQSPELCVLGISFIMLIFLGFLLLRTQLGYCFAVYGNNPKFFDHHGISTAFVFICGVVTSNALAGLAGYFVAQSSGFIDVNAGFGMALFCVTSLVLGKTMVPSKKPFSIAIPVVGVLTYCALQQLLLKAGFNLKYFTMIQSIIVLGILINKYRKLGITEMPTDNLGV